MTTTIKTRVRLLELRMPKPIREVFRIVCKGAKPTPKEQAQIDAAEREGKFVIARLIVKPKHDEQGAIHGNN